MIRVPANWSRKWLQHCNLFYQKKSVYTFKIFIHIRCRLYLLVLLFFLWYYLSKFFLFFSHNRGLLRFSYTIKKPFVIHSNCIVQPIENKDWSQNDLYSIYMDETSDDERITHQGYSVAKIAAYLKSYSNTDWIMYQVLQKAGLQLSSITYV